MSRSRIASLCALVLFAAPLAVAQGDEAATKTYFYMVLWPDRIAKFDPVSDRVVATAKMKNGLQFGARVSWDRKSFFVTTGQRQVVEVVDRASMEVVEEHVFAEQGWIHRVGRIVECPGGRKWYVQVDRIKVELDRYAVEKDQWFLYDRVEKKIEKRMDDMPRAIRGGRISPCGTKWHVFGRDITIVDPETLKEEGRIELSKPLYHGMGAIRVRGEDLLDGRDADRYRLLYSMRDPVKTDRSIVGIADISIKDRKVEKLTEWGRDPGVWGFEISKDKRFGVATKRGGGRGTDERETKLVVYDFETGKLLREKSFVFRPRRSLAAISPDGRKIYVGGAGNDFDVYDLELNLIKRVEFEGDLGGGIFVLDE